MCGQQSSFESTNIPRDNTWDQIIQLNQIITLDEGNPVGSRLP